jgi:signal transduction histidine kinase
MKPRGWGSSKCRGTLAVLFSALCLNSAAQEPSESPPRAGDAAPRRIVFTTFEYFPDDLGAQPPAPSAHSALTSKGFVAVEPPLQHRTRWLRAHFQLAETPPDVFALYVAGANRGLRAFVNQSEIGNTSLSDAETFGWNYPLFFSVPPALLRKGENTLDLLLTLTAAGRGSFRGVELGPHADLKPLYDRVLFWRVTGPQITTLIAVLLGAGALLVWLRRPKESVYGWFGLACLLAAVRNTHFFVTAPVSEWWYEVWAAVPLHWMSVVLIIFSFRLCAQRFPRIEAILVLAALAWSLAIVLGRFLAAVDLGYLWLVALSLGTIVYAAVQCWRAPRLERVLLLIAILVTITFGALDFLLLLGLRSSDTRIYLMPYSTLFFSLAMGAVLADAFAKARSQQERLNEELDMRLAVRERQLEERHQQLIRLEGERVAANERQRILRDIHDGLGSQLISSIHLVEGGALPSPAVAEVLRECVDDLRLAIDSLKPAGDDLLLVLGNFRYRMEPRLANAGVRLDWCVRAEARSPALTSEQVLHTLRIVQEAFTNALKHARPGMLSVRYETAETSTWTLIVTDDGAGFQHDAVVHGDGLRNMHARAAQAGVRLTVESSQGGTAVRIDGGSTS